jgi:hypothetical protein
VGGIGMVEERRNFVVIAIHQLCSFGIHGQTFQENQGLLSPAQ